MGQKIAQSENVMRFIHLDECRRRVCSGPVPVDNDAFVAALMRGTDGERRELAESLLRAKFGEL